MSNQRPRRRIRLAAGVAALSIIASLLVGFAAVSPAQAAATGSACTGADENAFADAGTAADCLKGYGIANGKDDGTFGEDDDLVRSQFANFVTRFLTAAGVDHSAREPFPDVDTNTVPNASVLQEIEEGHAAGVVNGFSAESAQVKDGDPCGSRPCEPGDFGPGYPMSVAQGCTIILNMMDAIHTANPAAPAGNSTGDPGTDYDTCVSMGILDLTAANIDGDVYPNEKTDVMKRGLFADMLVEALQLEVDAGVIPNAFEGDGTDFPTNPALGAGLALKQISDANNVSRGFFQCSATIPTSITKVDVALLSASAFHSTDDGITFDDTNADLFADRLQTQNGPRFETISDKDGNNTPVSTTPPQTFLNDRDTGPGGVITTGINARSTTSGIILFFQDLNNNNNLDVDSTGKATEKFGLCEPVIWLGQEASAGTFNLDLVAIGGFPVNIFDQVGTLGAPYDGSVQRSYKYDGTDTYQYATSGGPIPAAEGFSAVVAQGTTEAKDVFGSYLTNADSRTAPVYAPDVMTVIYSPGGTSTFQLNQDTPEQVGAVASALNDRDGDGVNDSINVTWTAPVNPDIKSYQVERATVANGVVGAFAVIPVNGVINPKGSTAVTGTSFVDTTVVANTTYVYRVRARANTVHNGPTDNADGTGQTCQVGSNSFAGRICGVDATTSKLLFPASGATSSAVPVSFNTTLSNGSNVGNLIDRLDTGDTVSINFDRPPTAAAAATIDLINLVAPGGAPQVGQEGDRFRLTNGGNATFSVAGNTLNIALTAAPTVLSNPAGSDGVPRFDGTFYLAVDAATGITNEVGAWNLPASSTSCASSPPGACPGDPSGLVIDLRPGGDMNESLFENITSATADPATDKVTIDNGGAVLIAGDTVFLTNASGVQQASATFTGNGQVLTSAQNFNTGDVLYLYYRTNANAGDDNAPSEALGIKAGPPVPPPPVAPTITGTGDINPLNNSVLVNFSQPVTIGDISQFKLELGVAIGSAEDEQGVNYSPPTKAATGAVGTAGNDGSGIRFTQYRLTFPDFGSGTAGQVIYTPSGTIASQPANATGQTVAGAGNFATVDNDAPGGAGNTVFDRDANTAGFQAPIAADTSLFIDWGQVDTPPPAAGQFNWEDIVINSATPADFQIAIFDQSAGTTQFFNPTSINIISNAGGLDLLQLHLSASLATLNGAAIAAGDTVRVVYTGHANGLSDTVGNQAPNTTTGPTLITP